MQHCRTVWRLSRRARLGLKGLLVMEKCIQRFVDWIPVSGKYTRVSLMGIDLDHGVMKLHSIFDGLIILMIPGNPGNERFYTHFGQAVLNNIAASSLISENSAVFCTVSHLNHVAMPKEYAKLGNHGCTDRFSLAEQIQHKIYFCLDYMPKSAKVVIIGHSIGSYIMLRILPDLLKYGFKIVRCIALFPTIEHMVDSPNGQRLFPWIKTLCKWDNVLRLVVSWLDYLPVSVKGSICSHFITNGAKHSPPCILQSAIELVDVNVIRNILFMSMDELLTVCALDETLLTNSDRCRFLYGTEDHWCPLRYGLELQEKLGKDLVTIDDMNCEHAFVINHGQAVACKVGRWITECC